MSFFRRLWASSIRSRIKAPTASGVITFVTVVGASLFTFSQLQPHLLFTDTTTAGGDMGAHTWTPLYVRDHVLPHWRLTGWTPDWYDGFPALWFYFPFPSMVIIFLDLFLPYGIAFKLVTVSGVVSLPIAAWAFGRLARLPFPVPACLSAAALLFLFDTGYSILGGNIASTLAGEFAFSIGLSLAFVLLGLVAGGLDTHRRRVAASIVFGLLLLSHILPTIFAFTGGVILLLMKLVTGSTLTSDKPPKPAPVLQLQPQTVVIGGDNPLPPPPFDWRAAIKTRLDGLWWVVTVGAMGGLLACFWLVPFVLRSTYMNDMGWEKIGTGVVSGLTLYGEEIKTYSDALFPTKLDWLTVAAFAGAGVSLFLRRRVGIFFIMLAVVSAIGFIYLPQGRLWNARILPFWYLSFYMLAALLVSELGWGVANAVRSIKGRFSEASRDIADGMTYVTPLVAMTGALLIVMSALPAPSWWSKSGLWHQPTDTGTVNFIPSWAAWNYSGYEKKPAYPEFQSLVEMMKQVGKDHGCGRAMWEYENELDRFGTPMAPMLLPTRTDGCIGSMEGLFFESSATVPYHFLNQSLLSKSPSQAMRNMPYGSLDVATGVTKLQLMGVKYYLAISPDAQAQAATDHRLTLVGTIPAAAATDGTERTWNAYEIAGTDLVSSLVNMPAVMTDQQDVTTTFKSEPPGERNARDAWLANSVTWYQDPANFDVLLASSGPKEWPRVGNANEPAQRVPLDPANVTFIATSDDSISFDVDRTGIPMLIKASYFPNWQVTGADKVYRVTPNLMVVIPTSNHVRLHFGRTPVDFLGGSATALGIFGLAWFGRRDRQNDTGDDIDELDDVDDSADEEESGDAVTDEVERTERAEPVEPVEPVERAEQPE